MLAGGGRPGDPLGATCMHDAQSREAQSGEAQSERASARNVSARYHPLVNLQYELALDRAEARADPSPNPSSPSPSPSRSPTRSPSKYPGRVTRNSPSLRRPLSPELGRVWRLPLTFGE